jgi:hypothetical protein
VSVYISETPTQVFLGNLESDEAAFQLLDAVWESGCNALDCAAVYAGGACEHIIGRWIQVTTARPPSSRCSSSRCQRAGELTGSHCPAANSTDRRGRAQSTRRTWL